MFIPYSSLMPPVVVMPESLKRFAKIPYASYGGKITKKEAFFYQNLLSVHSKHIVCFIGGFFDTYCKVLWHAFKIALTLQANNNRYKDSITQQNNPLFHSKNTKELNLIKNQSYMFYISFNCFLFLRDFIKNTQREGYTISFIAHSWGAKNIIHLCLEDNPYVESLLTLDCVSHSCITHRPSNIGIWENIYIEDYFENFSQANLAALIGGPKQYIPFADSNIALSARKHPRANHASIPTMLYNSKLFSY